MEKLDSFALNIEFLLISVVQGVALATLATASSLLVADLKFETFAYIISSFVLILSFWSQAIIHALSFIDWPLDLQHSFLYFLASFIEVMAFSHLDSPLKWFGFMGIFFIVTVILYFVDLRMIKERKNKFKTKNQEKLYDHILKQQMYELKSFLPAAIIFCGFSIFAIAYWPDIFIRQHAHLILITIQTLFGIYVLMTSIGSYKKRAKLLTDAN